MGSGRDKRKKAKGSKPGHGAEKTARKTEKNEGKAVRRSERRAEVGCARCVSLTGLCCESTGTDPSL